LQTELSVNIIDNELPVSIWLVSGHGVRRSGAAIFTIMWTMCTWSGQLRLSLSHLSALSYRVADKACLTRTIAALVEPLTEMPLQQLNFSLKRKSASAGSALCRRLKKNTANTMQVSE